MPETLYVKSKSQPGRWHTVTKDDDGTPTGCTCRGWRWRKTCRHVVIAADVSATEPPKREIKVFD